MHSSIVYRSSSLLTYNSNAQEKVRQKELKLRPMIKDTAMKEAACYCPLYKKQVKD
jgi:hypothetical protein